MRQIIDKKTQHATMAVESLFQFCEHVEAGKLGVEALDLMMAFAIKCGHQKFEDYLVMALAALRRQEYIPEEPAEQAGEAGTV